MVGLAPANIMKGYSKYSRDFIFKFSKISLRSSWVVIVIDALYMVFL
jgi:hypothetical protein